ncbi:MAG: prohibitin family protein [Clostridia bacterium]|nr:prohibitin family protein [Clostridia bacterium]
MFKKLAKHGVIVVIILIALAVLLAKGFTRVPVGSTGIMVTLGRVQDGSTLSEGLHFHLPFLQDIVTMDNRVQKLELDTEAFSKDIQTVSAKLAVNYRLRPESSFSVYKSYGTRFEQNIIVPATHEALKSVSAQYTAEELISKRAESSDKMRDELDAKLTGMGITVTDFNIIDFDFSVDFINAVEAKQVAEQVKKRAATENETAIAQAEREKQVAIKQAEAAAEKVRIEAEAKANAVKLAAEAEAFRLQSINQNLTDLTIRNTLAERWNGKLPSVMGSGATGLMDMTGLMDVEPTFTENAGNQTAPVENQ